MIEVDYEQAPEPWYRKLTETDLLYEYSTKPIDWNEDNDENNNNNNNNHDTDNNNNNDSNCNTNDNNNCMHIDLSHADDSLIVEVVNLHFSVTATELVQHLQYIIGITIPDGGIYRCELKCKYITTISSGTISIANNDFANIIGNDQRLLEEYG